MAKKEENNIKFDFGTSTQETPVNSAESKELNDGEATEAHTDGAELTDNTSDNSEDKAEASNEATKGEEAGSEATNGEEAGKAVVSYIGNGVWRDAKGKCWSRNERKGVDILSTRSYDKGEYEERDDLKFMVKYGEMKLSLV